MGKLAGIHSKRGFDIKDQQRHRNGECRIRKILDPFQVKPVVNAHRFWIYRA
jgi:hypothetical protein